MPSSLPHDPNLLRRCRQGDPAAWRLLVERYTVLVYRLCLRMLREPREAEDACQDVFLRLYHSFHRYDPSRPLEPWLARIAYNVCLSRLSLVGRRMTEVEDPDRLDARAGVRPGPEALAEEREAGRLLELALEELSAQDRALLVMHYQEGFSQAEVAEATGLHVANVKTRLFRARELLRRRLAPLLGGSEVGS